MQVLGLRTEKLLNVWLRFIYVSVRVSYLYSFRQENWLLLLSHAMLKIALYKCSISNDSYYYYPVNYTTSYTINNSPHFLSNICCHFVRANLLYCFLTEQRCCCFLVKVLLFLSRSFKQKPFLLCQSSIHKSIAIHSNNEFLCSGNITCKLIWRFC